MLPSKKRLSRSGFVQFLVSPSKSVFNPLGTLKYKEDTTPKASIVISSKTEKRAVYRNKLRRQLYTIFNIYFKTSKDIKQYVLHVSKQAGSFKYEELQNLLNELLKKTTK